MKINSLYNYLKYEFLFLSRSERTKGYVVYIIGLPLVSYLLVIFSNTTDSSFGISLLSVCAINIFYAPLQFSSDRKYIECIFSKNVSFYSYVVSKMLFLQLNNCIMYILIIPLNIIFYDKDAFIFTTTFFIYCVGFASPIIVLISGLMINNNFYKNSNNNKIKFTHILIGLLPFSLVVIILTIFHSTILIVYLYNLIFGIIGLTLSPLGCIIVDRNIIKNRYFL